MSEIGRAIEIFRTEIRQGFERVDARFDQVDARFEQIESSVDSRFDRVDRRFNDVERKIDAIALNLKAIEREHSKRIRKLEERAKLQGQG